MKYSCLCPKCRSTDIARIPGQIGAQGNNILTGATIFSAVKVSRFLCLNCGFSEEWVESKDDLKKIRANFK